MTSSEPQLKNLKVLVNDVEYVNADFAEITVSDGPNGVRVQALPFVTKTAKTATTGASSAIIEALTAAVAARAESKAQAADAAATPEQSA